MEVLHLIVFIDVVFSLLKFRTQVADVPGHVGAKLHWVLPHELPHPTNCSLVQERVRNIGRLPLGVFTSPWRKPVMLQSCKVCRTDVATGGMIEPRPTVGEDNTWIWGPSCPEHLPQNLWQLLHHLRHALGILMPVFAHDMDAHLACGHNNEPPHLLVAPLGGFVRVSRRAKVHG